MKDHLFVYGSLMDSAGSKMSRYLRDNAFYVGKSWFHGRLYDLGEYPAAIKSRKRRDRVYGEIYQLKEPQKNLKVIDRYEETGPGFNRPYLYKREIVEVWIKGKFLEGKFLECWTYLYNRELQDRRLIRSGDYKSHKSEK